MIDRLVRFPRDQGVPVLMVTHDSRLFGVADRTIDTEDGRAWRE